MADRARYEQALSRGHSYSWDQQWQEAVEEFEAALAELANEPAPYAGLGMAYSELGQLEEALESYKQAARYSKGDIIYLRQVAEVQEQLARNEDAGQTYLAIGEIQRRRGAEDEAVINWHRAAQLSPNLLGARQRLAHYYTRQGQTRAAIIEYLAVARLYQARKDVERALKTCRSALNLDPRNAELLTAIERLEHGEELVAPHRSEAPLALGVELQETVDQMAPGENGRGEQQAATASPVQNARRMAMEQLAEELFEEEEQPSDAARKMERDALISQALDAQTHGQINEAISYYEQALDAGVTGPAAHFNLGLLYQVRLRFEDAIREFEKVVNDPRYRLASHFALGESYRARGQIDRAVEHFITVLQIVDLSTVQHNQADRLIELYENLADSLQTRGEPEKATEFANALVEFLSHRGWEDKVRDARKRLDALSGSRMMILGDILTAGSARVLEALYLSQEYARRQMVDTAIEEVYRAIAISPDYLPAHIQLGELLASDARTEAATAKFSAVADTFRMRGDESSAVNMYERVVAISPFDLSIRARLVDLLKRRGQIDRALEHYLAMGEAYYQLAQVEKARETYTEALKLAPRGSSESSWRARLLRQIGDIDLQRFDWRRALAAYRELRQLDPDDERTAMTLVDLYYKLGQPAYAVHELDQYLKYLVSSGRSSKVVGILEDMATRYPAEPPLVYRLVRLHLAQGRQEEAIARLDALGESQLDAGQNAEAIATITRIVQLKPPDVARYRQLLKQLQR